MAAIDKLYLNDYEDFKALRIWAIRYYPKLMSAFYEFFMSWSEFDSAKKDIVKRNREIADREFRRVFGDPDEHNGLDFGVNNIKKQYWEGIGYACGNDQALDEAIAIFDAHAKTNDELYEEASIPVMNTSFAEDRRLKWTCPIPVVREYLQNQCGVKKNREWLYRIFWRGKKDFGF